jgi:4-amino-4-deoxy-L-arabinose transferase-like glycosyltransferase
MGAMIIPIVIFTYIICNRELRLFSNPYLIFGTIVSVLLLSAWHWAAFSNYGEQFVKGYFLNHLLERTTTAMDGHTGNFLTYFGVIPNKGRPWAIIGFCLIPVACWRIFSNREKKHILPVIWSVSVLLIFSVVKTKLHWYIMPLYPALSLLTGWALEKILKKRAVIIVSILSVASLAYLAYDRNIFDLDYSPDIKKMAVRIAKKLPPGEKVYMYAVNDPGMQFYLGKTGNNIQNLEQFKKIFTQKGKFAILNKEYISYAGKADYKIILEDDHYVVLRTN